MANVMASVISHIVSTIPAQILRLTFNPDGDRAISLDEHIMRKIVDGRVLLDCNQVTGKLTKIPLQPNWLIPTMDIPVLDTGITKPSEVYCIPPEARENRDICVVIKLSWAGMYGMIPNQFMYDQGGNSLQNLSNFALKSRTLSDANPPPMVELLGNNMVRVSPPIYTDGLSLECFMEFDREFTNLGPNAIRPLRNLIVSATKTYIYNQLIVNIGTAAISAGQTNTEIRQIIEEYKDEKDKYDDLLNKFKGACAMSREAIKYLLRKGIG